MKPMALERYMGYIKTAQYWRQLQTVKFALLNSFQVVETLWPVVGTRGMLKGIQLYHSKEGQAILAKYNIIGTTGKMFEAGVKETRIERFTPAGASERANQGRAFLSLYDHGVNTLGMAPDQAATYARLRGQLFTQFTYVPGDVPPIMRGPIAGTVFQFTRFNLKQAELVMRLVRDRNYSGLARWTAAKLLLGGLRIGTSPLKVLGLGAAGVALHQWLKDKYGEEAAQTLEYGLPGLIGVDLGTSVNILPDLEGQNIPELIGNKMLGPTGQDILHLGAELMEEKTVTEIPAYERIARFAVEHSATARQIEYLMKALDADTSQMDDKGRANYKLEVIDLWKRAAGFRPIAESQQRSQIDALMAYRDQYNDVIDRAVTYTISGNDTAAQAEMAKWNGMFPEHPITRVDLLRRIRSRKEAVKTPAVERQVKQLPRKVRKATEGIVEEPKE
jgi:hypothetical protein